MRPLSFSQVTCLHQGNPMQLLALSNLCPTPIHTLLLLDIVDIVTLMVGLTLHILNLLWDILQHPMGTLIPLKTLLIPDCNYAPIPLTLHPMHIYMVKVPLMTPLIVPYKISLRAYDGQPTQPKWIYHNCHV